MIRRGTTEDLDEIVKFAPMMKTQSLFPQDIKKIAVEILMSLENGEVFVAVHGGQMIGTAGYRIVNDWYTSHKFITDKWLAVREIHRGGFLAGKLLMKLEKESERLNLEFLPGISGDLTHAKVFERRYKTAAMLFRKDV